MFVVTGGGSGLGRALAHALADRGQSVIIVGRHEHLLKETAAYAAHLDFVTADVATHDGREALISRLSGTKKISGIVHNAGVIEPIAPIHELSEQAFRQVMSTNVEAPLFLTQRLLEPLKGGRVLHIGSGAAYFPVVGWSLYCMSKAALSMLTRSWQVECQTVSCASVKPGIVDTNMQRIIRESSGMAPEKQRFFKELYQQRRLLSSDTVASFLCWLLLDVDAGRYVSKEWDIYDTTHHHEWLKPPLTVPSWE